MSGDPRCIGCGNVTGGPDTLCQYCREIFEHTVNSPDVHSPYVGGQRDDDDLGFTMNSICHLCGGQKANSPSLFCQFCVNGWDDVVHTYRTPGCDVPMDQLNPSFNGTVCERNETDPRSIGCGNITDAPDTLCQSCRDSFEHSINSPQVRSPNVNGGQADDDDPMSADPHCIGCGNVTDGPDTLCQYCREIFEHTVNSPDVHSPYVGGQRDDDDPMSADPRCIGCGNGTEHHAKKLIINLRLH